MDPHLVLLIAQVVLTVAEIVVYLLG